MTGSDNRVVLLGKLAVDPVKTSTGLRMQVVTNHSFLNSKGVREEREEQHDVCVEGSRAEGLSRVLCKGAFLLVEGHLVTRVVESNGEKGYFTTITAVNVILGERCGAERRQGEVS